MDVGQGYEYQWDVTLYILMTHAIGLGDTADDFGRALAKVGAVESIWIEANTAEETLADLALVGQRGTTIKVQIKKRSKGMWEPRCEGLARFLTRVDQSAPSSSTSFLFVSNRPLGPSAQLQFDQRKNLDFVHFHEPTKVRNTKPISGLGWRITQKLGELGALDPDSVYRGLFKDIVEKSTAPGGTSMRVGDIKAWLESHLRRPILGAATAPHFAARMRLMRIPSGLLDQGPSWNDLEGAEIWKGDPLCADAIEYLHNDPNVVVLCGPPASGKTVLVRLAIKAEFMNGGEPDYWDFLESRQLSCSPLELLSLARVQSIASGRLPVLVLENVHLNTETLDALLASRQQEPSPTALLLTAQPTPAMKKRIDRWRLPVLDTGVAILDRARAMRDAYVAANSHLNTGPFRSVDVPADLWLAALMLRAVDEATNDVAYARILDRLQRRLLEVERRKPKALRILRFIAALGRLDIETDIRAMAAAMEIDGPIAREYVKIAEDVGVVHFDDGLDLCGFWHLSLATMYWKALSYMDIED